MGAELSLTIVVPRGIPLGDSAPMDDVPAQVPAYGDVLSIAGTRLLVEMAAVSDCSHTGIPLANTNNTTAFVAGGWLLGVKSGC